MSNLHGGWRPRLGWVGLMTVAGQGIAVPACNVVLGIMGLPLASYMPAEVLACVIGTTLGVAGLRSFDKLKDTAPKG